MESLPKLKADKIRVGVFYIDKKYSSFAREIIREDDEGNVFWRSYYLESGEPTGDNLCCSKQRIVDWACREATPEEVARLKREEVMRKEARDSYAFAVSLLEAAPDYMLLAEIERRGWKLK